jgi:hypothetical protein
MVNKGPQTQKGMMRKMWSGDGRKRAPLENFEDALKAADDATARAFGFKKKTTKAKKR